MIEIFSSQGIRCIENGICARCNSKNIAYDTLGQYCRDCIQYGISHEHKFIERREIKRREVNTNYYIEYELSQQQKEASSEIITRIRQQKNYLIHAVCGAGKTEIMYEPIKYCLNNNLRMCLAIPRTEVVKELHERISKAFPNLEVLALYGGKHIKEFDLLVCTVNQLINFHSEFDVIMIDEVDAYPYTVDSFLEKLVFKSIKKEHSIIYLSATPKKEHRKLEKFLLPARYHRKPLPVPKFLIRTKYIKHILKFISQNERTIIYINDVEEGFKLEEELQDKGVLTYFVHSGSYNKDRIINKYKNENMNVLITTTILERGITIENVNVIVLDTFTFTKESLIQICGRVGRKIGYETGNILYLSPILNRNMKRSINEIKYLNKKAKELNLIDL